MSKRPMGTERSRRSALTRRFFLGGAGAAVAIPFLPSAARFFGERGIARAGGTECTSPRRLLAWYLPNGIHMDAFRPSSTGSDYTMPTILEPLASYKDDLLVITGLANRPGQSDGPGDHAAGTGSFITATHVYKTDGADIRNGISMDQVAAMHIGTCTRFPSLELGVEGGESAGSCDSGYSCAYSRNISWSGPTTPMPKMTNPQAIFDRLFEGFDPTASVAEIERRRAYQSSVLDYALDDANALQPRLGATDRRKLDEYLTSLREVELRVAAIEAPLCDRPDRPGADLDVTAKIDVLSDLQVVALQCDLTRVITFMMGNAGSGRTYDFLGIGEGHHTISHHDSNTENFRKLIEIDRWEMERFAYFLGRMKSVVDADGTSLLDSSAIYLSSEISDGNRHNHDDLPVIVAGRAGGAIETGRHLAYDGTPMADLFVRLLNDVGVPITEFGDDSTGPLEL
jgi:hypothetical protein